MTPNQRLTPKKAASMALLDRTDISVVDDTTRKMNTHRLPVTRRKLCSSEPPGLRRLTATHKAAVTEVPVKTTMLQTFVSRRVDLRIG